MHNIYSIQKYNDSPIPAALMHEENKKFLIQKQDQLIHGKDLAKIGYWSEKEMGQPEKKMFSGLLKKIIISMNFIQKS